MNTWFGYILRIIPVFLILQGVVAGQDWMHGSLHIHSVPEGIVINQIGQGRQSGEGASKVIPSRISLSGQAEESLLLAGSNGLHLSFNEGGSLTFERFEQRIADGKLRGRSRSILSMDRGAIELDSRLLAGGSPFLLELPIGSVILDRFLGSLVLKYDTHIQIYRFEFFCAEGSLALTNLQGEQFTIQANQVITGAGSSLKPSLEISDLNERMANKLEDFVLRYQSIPGQLDENSPRWLAQMLPVAGLQEVTDSALQRSANPEGKQPYVIEFSPKPKLLIPRHGSVK